MHVHIFYADDDNDDQGMFLEAIKEISNHVQVTSQKNGNELIRQLNNPPPYPNIVFLDLNMPIKNGYEVLKEIKNSEQTKDLPVVIFTTSDHGNAVEITRSLGARLYVPKPVSFSALINILKYVLAIDWKTFTPTEKEFVYRTN